MDQGIKDGKRHSRSQTPHHSSDSPQTYEGDAGSQEKDPHQQVFKLLYHQLPQGLAWGRGKKRSPKG